MQCIHTSVNMQTDSPLTATRMHCVFKELHSPNSIEVEEDKEHQRYAMGGGGGGGRYDVYGYVRVHIHRIVDVHTYVRM